ncbi:hypothetical protein, partial [Pseudomonas sp. 78_B]|uniref:hypothetical protein n=1 Tax=Pseudomonas sp. 78_B TaxID=2813566 RepID=UPI001A9CEEAD
YSLTTEPTTKGEYSRAIFNPEVNSVLNKLDNKYQGPITNEELNKIVQFYFKVPPINPTLFNFNSAITDTMVFDLNNVTVDKDANGDVKNATVTLTEKAHGIKMAVTISVEDFHEVFRSFEFQPTTNS